jgi:hypothetical protein
MNLPELQRIRRERREDVRTWGAGHGGRMGTPSPMYGTRSGGMPQPAITVQQSVGQTITVRADEVEVAPSGTVVTWASVAARPVRAGYANVSVPTDDVPFPLTGEFGIGIQFVYADGYTGGGTVEVLIAGEVVHTETDVEGSEFWHYLKTGKVKAGDSLQVRVAPSDGTRTIVDVQLTVGVDETTQGRAVDPQPEPGDEESFTQQVFHNRTSQQIVLPSGVQAGDAVVLAVGTARLQSGTSGTVDHTVTGGTRLYFRWNAAGISASYTEWAHSLWWIPITAQHVSQGYVLLSTSGRGSSADDGGGRSLGVLIPAAGGASPSNQSEWGGAEVSLAAGTLTFGISTRTHATSLSDWPQIAPDRTPVGESASASNARLRVWPSAGGPDTVSGQGQVSTHIVGWGS